MFLSFTLSSPACVVAYIYLLYFLDTLFRTMYSTCTTFKFFMNINFSEYTKSYTLSKQVSMLLLMDNLTSSLFLNVSLSDSFGSDYHGRKSRLARLHRVAFTTAEESKGAPKLYIQRRYGP